MNTYDVVIVGGGIIGGSIAFELSRRNLRVALLDKREPMREASWAAAGMLSPAPDCPSAIPLVPLSRASLAMYPQFIAEIEEASSMRTGYRTEGTIEVLCHGDAERELSTLVALHRGLGLACEPLHLDEAREMEPALGRAVRAAALLPEEASVKPRELIAALLAGAECSGAKLIPGTEALSLVRDGNRCTGIKTASGEIFSAAHIVIAAGCWTSTISGAAPYAPTIPVRGQMLTLKHAGTPIRRVLRSEHGYIVPRDPASPQTLVLGSTLEHADTKSSSPRGESKQFSRRQMNLRRNSRKRNSSRLGADCGLELPINCRSSVRRMWGDWQSPPAIPQRILLAPVTAKLITEWITEGRLSSRWSEFSPLRFSGTIADRSAAAL